MNNKYKILKWVEISIMKVSGAFIDIIHSMYHEYLQFIESFMLRKWLMFLFYHGMFLEWSLSWKSFKS